MKRLLTCLLVLCILSAIIAPVYAQTDNLAFGKPTSSSGTMDAYLEGNINDGNYNTIWARSGLVPNAYIQVDLLDTYVITSVVLHNRLDGANESDAARYRQNVDVWFSNDPEFKTYEKVIAMTTSDPGYGVPVEVKPPNKRAYRYVRAVKSDMFIFVLAEIEVYGYPASANQAVLEFGDIKNTKYEGAITLLQHLGLADGVSEEEFGINNLITRAQAADMVVRSFQPDYFAGSVGGYMPFTDVKEDNLYYDSILAAYNFGYVKVGENAVFNPNNYVSQQEFLIMVLRAMGYEQLLASQPMYAANLLGLSKQLALLRNVSSQNQGSLSYGDSALIIYNALLSEKLTVSFKNDDMSYNKSDITVLEDLYEIKLYEGIVNETRKYNLVGDAKAINQSVRVGNVKFRDPGAKLDGLLGKRVTIGVYAEGEDVVSVVWASNKNYEITLPAKTISAASTSDKIVTTNENGKADTYSLSDVVDVIHNGAPYPGFSPADLVPKSGSVTLLDNNDDEVYDVVYIDTYDVYYVMGSYSDDETLTFIDDNNETHVFDMDYLKITSSEGFPAMPSGVKNGVVIKVYKSESAEEARIVIFSKPNVVGLVSESSDDELEVDGTFYEYAFGYFTGDALRESPQIDKYMSVYLDENMDVIWLRAETETNNANWIIGFPVEFHSKSGLGNEVQFKIFTEQGRFGIYDVTKRLEVDGSRIALDKFKNNLYENAEYAKYFKGNLLRFKINEDGKIFAFDTLSLGENENENEITFKYDGEIAAGLYAPLAQSFWLGQKWLTFAHPGAPVFMIPMVDGQHAFGGVYDSLYEIRKLQSVAGDRSSQQQNIREYMRDEDGFAACYMKTTAYEELEGSSAMVVTQETAPFILVNKVTQVSAGYKILGIDINSGNEISFIAEDDVKLVESGKIYQIENGGADPANEWFVTPSRRLNLGKLMSADAAKQAEYIKNIKDIRFGDILRYELAGDTSFAVERVFKYEPNGDAPKQIRDVWLAVEGNYPNFFIGYNRFQLSAVSEISKNAISFDINGGVEKFARNGFKYVYWCDSKKRELTKETIDNLYAYMKENCRAMVFVYSTTPTGIVIYEYNQ